MSWQEIHVFAFSFQFLFLIIYVKECPRMNKLNSDICNNSKNLEIRENEFKSISKLRIRLTFFLMTMGWAEKKLQLR